MRFECSAWASKVGGLTIFLDRDNCEIVNKTKNKNPVILHLKRKSDGEEGQTHLKAQDQFETISAQLLNWAFVSEDIMGLTLNQFGDLKTNLKIEKVQGRLQLTKN